MKSKYVAIFIFTPLIIISVLLLNNGRMKFLSHKNVTYRTGLAKTDVKERLAAATEFEKTLRNYTFGKPQGVRDFEGVIKGDSFCVKRIIGYRNPFLPMVEGTIEGEQQGTIIQVKYRFQDFVRTIFFIWFICFIIGFLNALLHSFVNGGFNPKPLIIFISILLFMLAFAYGMIMFGFNHGYKKTNQNFKELLEARIVNIQ